jgi:hypothetical protein
MAQFHEAPLVRGLWAPLWTGDTQRLVAGYGKSGMTQRHIPSSEHGRNQCVFAKQSIYPY